jgi:hypothetical protein
MEVLNKNLKEKIKSNLRIAAKPDTSKIHVFPAMGNWIVKREGAKRVMAKKNDKDEAIQLAKNQKKIVNMIIIHELDGSVHQMVLA